MLKKIAASVLAVGLLLPALSARAAIVFGFASNGVLDPNTFVNTMTYTVTSGSGLFAAGRGFGTALIQIFPPQAEEEPFSFVERGQFTIPEPGTLALLGLGLAGLAVSRRRRQ